MQSIASFPEHVILNIISYFEEPETYFSFFETCRTIKTILDQVRPLPEVIYLNHLKTHPTGMDTYFNGLVSITFDPIKIEKNKERRYVKRLTSSKFKCELDEDKNTVYYKWSYVFLYIKTPLKYNLFYVDSNETYYILVTQDFDDMSVDFKMEILNYYPRDNDGIIATYSFFIKDVSMRGVKFTEIKDESCKGYKI